ncbi:rho GTPase-activating protein 23-like isoform X6 [Crassostrea virginica]|uniref:Rho GTPase-activating protein 21-like isoform X6 n=1 Tax=Crassostrea virginica TaxID=6565 RepID=A0A8B8BLQ2_CRAVI|nr:rho GTPase-activating protein 21-like isoform X6 [Crassostrea virginica]
MESFIVQFRKSKVASHRRNVHSDGDQTIVSSVISRWPAPKTILIPKTEQGYGFTLRHFICYPSGAAAHPEPSTEKEQDDSSNQGPSYKRKRLSFLDPMDTIFVKNVRNYSPAYNAGLKTGDRVITVNDQSVSQKSYAQVIGLIQQSEGILKLEVLPKDETEEDSCQVAHSCPQQTQQAELCHNQEAEKLHPYRNPTFRRFISSDELRERPRSLITREEITPNSEDRILVKTMDPPSKLKTSTSYTSGLSVFREPWNSTGSRLRESPSREFMERRQDFESRAKENHDQPPNKAYSFGLFYDKTKSASDLSMAAVPRRQEHVLHPTDSQENISKSTKGETRVIPLENRRSREINQDKTGQYFTSSSSSRHSFPDSMAAHQSASLSSGLSNTNNSKSEYHMSTRQYIPVVSAQPSHKMSASVDNLDSRSSYNASERNVRTRIYEQPNQGGGRTFIVKIGDQHYGGGVSQGSAESEMSGNAVKQTPRYGTAFALTRSPMSGGMEQGRVVSQKKFMFESGKSDNLQAKSPVDRHKTEIDKITSHRKFNSVATRVQSFEKEEPQHTSNIRITRRSSQDRCGSVPPESLGQSGHSSQQPYQEQAPIRIYVSQGSVNSSGSPIVEIVPMYPNSGNKTVTSPKEVTSQPIIHIKQSDDVDGGSLSRHKEDVSHASKPVRKDSFLAAVNGSQQRYSGSRPDSEHLSTSSESSSLQHSTLPWESALPPGSFCSESVIPVSTADDLALPNSPIKDVKSTVVLRRKSETSQEDDAIKLQRRTSYLMATAKDRDSHKLSLDKTLSPSQSQTEIHVQITPHPKPSMRKLKYFFGEKTPRIAEATERRQDPASPLQEVTKKGPLLCKTDVTDGKKASDRSWKPVWVELRGHALYICKERKDPATSHTFSFDDQPISIKSCLVDIAHDYTKKKNVFRLKTFNGSEYLFQAEENSAMLDWIRAIQTNNNPDADKLSNDKGQMETDLILRSRNQIEPPVVGPILTSHGSTSSLRTSPQVAPKAPKHSSKSKLIRIPHSPSIKRKNKESRSWSLSKFKSFRKGSSNANQAGESENNDMFGVPLDSCIPSPNNDFVPMIVDLCTKIVEARGLEVTGVYRVPGNTAAVNMMMEELNKGIDNMNVEHEKWCDVNVISSLLKTFFRKLPDSLITSALYQDFIDANRVEDLEMRMLKLKRLIHKLPEHHFETFKHLAEHLSLVASYGNMNKMDARNLAIVFGPTLIKSKDDDMTSIIRDMSDQCRIIESIILHNEWFFSSWDQDSYVPLEEGREDDEAPSNPSVSKMSCDDDDNTINPRDIVSSIVQAANQKMRKKSAPTLGEDLNASLTDGGFRERNIDLEIKKHRKMVSQAELKARSSPNLPAMAASPLNTRQQLSSGDSSENIPERRLAMSHEGIDSSEWEQREQREGTTLYSKSRHFSSESLDHHEDYNGQTFSHSTIEALRKIEEEARALREKEERRQQRERWKIERQRHEQGRGRESDNEKSKSNENLMDFGTIWHSTSDIFNKLAKGESKEFFERKLSSEKYDRNSTTSVSDRSESSRKNSTGSSSGGKYFVVQTSRTNSRDMLIQSSGDSPVFPSKRASSMERLLESPKKDFLSPPPRVHPGDRGQSKSGGKEKRRSKKGLSRSDSARRGSLDSLINLGRQQSHHSSDSEDGSDLLSDLTSTFDQKLQILVNPKYKLSGTTVKPPTEVLEKESAIACLPPQKPLAQAQCNKFGLCSSNDMLEKQYRDPSLHRSPKDAKIGIAYRFERNPLGSSLVTSPQHSVDGQIDSNYMSYPPHEDTRLSATTHLPVSAHVQEIRTISSNMYGSKDFRPTGGKSERSEINIPFHRTQQEKQYRVRYERSSSTPKDLESDVSVIRTSHSLGNTSQKQTFSPPVERRKEKRQKRRHTVGGTDDLEHFKALMTVINPRGSGSQKLSAWDQLQPAVKDMPRGSNRSLLSWLQNERMRGSTPDLSAEHDSRPKFY